MLPRCSVEVSSLPVRVLNAQNYGNLTATRGRAWSDALAFPGDFVPA
jgi:hypothetical protein